MCINIRKKLGVKNLKVLTKAGLCVIDGFFLNISIVVEGFVYSSVLFNLPSAKFGVRQSSYAK